MIDWMMRGSKWIGMVEGKTHQYLIESFSNLADTYYHASVKYGKRKVKLKDGTATNFRSLIQAINVCEEHDQG
jgi:hypothetical protein